MKDYKAEFLESVYKYIYDTERPFLSGNLINTMYWYSGPTYGVLEIPAARYDVKTWSKTGVIVYTGGSYAKDLNMYGTFHSNNHRVGFVDRAIRHAMNKVIGNKAVRIEIY